MSHALHRPRRWWLYALAAAAILVAVSLISYLALAQAGYLPPLVRPEALPTPVPATARDERWQQDIDYLAANLIHLHPNPFFSASREAFERAVTELKAEVPTSSDAELWTGIAATAAMLGDGHTEALLHEPGFFSLYPVQLAWYGGDLVVTAAADASAVGARVTHVGSLSLAEAYERVARFIAYDNAQSLRNSATTFLRTPEVLAAVGAVVAGEPAVFRLELADGERLTLELAGQPISDEGFQGVSLYEALNIERPLRGQNPDRNYWFTYLEDARAIYFHYRRCADDPQQPFEEFTRELMAFIDQRDVERIVVDLRFNGGGNSRILRPFLEAIQARPALNARGHLYVLIGAQTFSSAMMNAIDFDTQTEAILMGEATGGRPNGYGETRVFYLPNSRIPVQYSTRFFRNMPGADPEAVEPEVQVSLSWMDVLAGRDTVLETALGFQA